MIGEASSLDARNAELMRRDAVQSEQLAKLDEEMAMLKAKFRALLPEDPLESLITDPKYNGHSVGHWEGDTLVVDTVDIVPQAPLAVSEAAGLPNNGEMHVIERIHLADKDILHDDLEIIAPKLLTRPWKTTRIFFRQRARKFDIVEGVCATGDLAERTDAEGDSVFVPVEKSIWGHTVAVPK